MSEMRIKNGLALGPYGTVGPTSSQNLIVPGDTTPDVSLGCFFVTANTSATTITYFDVLDQGGTPSTAANGKLIKILFRDALTTIQNGVNLFLANTQGAIPANTVLDLIYYGSSWYEVSRATNNQSSTEQANQFRRLNVSVAGSQAINVTTANVVFLTVTGATLGITGFAGGVGNQTITIVTAASSQIISYAQSGGNLALAGTNGFIASNSATYNFFTTDGSQWFSTSGLVSP